MTERIRLNEGNRRWWTLAAMCFALFMVMLDNTVVNVALPSIQDDLGASLSGLEWTVNAYTLTFAVLLVTGGRLGDIFGHQRLLLIGRRRQLDRVPVDCHAHRAGRLFGSARPAQPGADDEDDPADHLRRRFGGHDQRADLDERHDQRRGGNRPEQDEVPGARVAAPVHRGSPGSGGAVPPDRA